MSRPCWRRSSIRARSSLWTSCRAQKPAAATLQAAPIMKFTVQKQVRFHHCDPAGIVFYPQFFYLLHEVQEDFLAHIGFAEHLLIAGGTGVPIVDLKTEFLGMCRNGDQLTMTLELTRIGNAS